MSLVIRESVRGIVEYILQQGSLDDRHVSNIRAMEGTIAHSKVQSDNAKIYVQYEKEVKMDGRFEYGDITLLVEGRADGIIKENNEVIIEEIKSTYRDLLYIDEDYNLLHWAQSKFYGYFYCKDNNVDSISIRLSYYNLNTNEVKSFQKVFSINSLKEFVFNIVNEYIDTVRLRENFKIERNKSIRDIKFPFETYRKGQRELAVNCYSSIKQKSVLFAQAPTGIGKTISTIFPSVKSLGEGRGERIVYLTSKTITRVVAEEAYMKLINNGLQFRFITITAKEKACINNEVKCNPDDCPYAVDYFTKINSVIKEILKEESTFSRGIIEKYARKFKVCPFELSLDLSLWCDGVICDYNYAFDPRAKLKRIFEENNEKNIILIDEAHNLVDRARDMYSGEIFKSKVLSVTRLLKGKVPKLYKVANNINKELIEIRRELEEKNINVLHQNIKYKELIKLLKLFIAEADEYLSKSKNTNGYEEVLDFYYEVRSFVSLSELYSEKYTTILTKDKNEFSIKIFCIDPSENIGEVINNSYSTIIFSATLSPIKYYVDLLGGNETSFRVKFSSPFKKENLSTYLYPLDMRYVNRYNNIDNLCTVINRFINDLRGNYIVFLPSFEYLKKVYSRYIELYGEENTIVQGQGLSESDKEDFLNNFDKEGNIAAFSVVGGMFSEGVDLPGEKLIGAVVVGVGFPMVSIENNIIREYFGANGFDYAYAYPGINKVLQSAGRVIRTESDKGRVLLVDNRYNNFKYRSMLPNEWNLEIYK